MEGERNNEDERERKTVERDGRKKIGRVRDEKKREGKRENGEEKERREYDEGGWER